jgi:hypothetical protein
MPEPSPFGETSLRAIVLAICCADALNVPGGGDVESVLTVLTHLRFGRVFATHAPLNHLLSPSLEELHVTFVLFGRAACLERAEIPSPSSRRE